MNKVIKENNTLNTLLNEYISVGQDIPKLKLLFLHLATYTELLEKEHEALTEEYNILNKKLDESEEECVLWMKKYNSIPKD